MTPYTHEVQLVNLESASPSFPYDVYGFKERFQKVRTMLNYIKKHYSLSENKKIFLQTAKFPIESNIALCREYKMLVPIAFYKTDKGKKIPTSCATIFSYTQTVEFEQEDA